MGISLSFSAASRYILSPMSYYLHYYLRLRPVETGSALIFGSALDVGLNALLAHKKSGDLIDVELAKRCFDIQFSSVAPGAIKYSKADADTTSLPDGFGYDTSSDIPLAWHCLKHKGHILIEEYAEQVLPRIQQVYEIQKEISLTNELGDTFTGIIDLIAKIDDKVWIVDNKSSSITYAKDSVEKSEQLASYYEAMREEYDLAGACYIVIPKKLRKVKRPRVEISMIFGSVGEELIEKTFQDYENVLDGVKNARFQCSGECCRLPWPCSYRSYCASGGKDTTGLKFEEKRK